MSARWLILAVGATALIVGLIFLLVPVTASGPNGSISCGNAIASDLKAAEEKDNSNPGNLPIVGGVVQQVDPSTRISYVSECNSALSARRAWSIPVAVVGLIVVGGAFLVRERATVR